MKIVLIVIGKTKESYLKYGINKFVKRIRFFSSFKYVEIPSLKGIKNVSILEIKKREGELIIKFIKKDDYPILLDIDGKEFSSDTFANKISQFKNLGIKKLIFIIGGAYGFSDEIINFSKERVSLSKMTFSHQMVRLFFLEQLYRSFTIINNKKYHN